MSFTYSIPESVVEDTHSYRREVEKFLAKETSAVAFRAIRVPMGIYEQRENDTYMVRVRGAAGVFLPHQAKRIAELAAEFGSGIVHVTTRQDLQIHRVPIEKTPDILESLLEVGLSSRGGGGNTVRNISACPHAGACADEVFDVTPYAVALTGYLLRERGNFNLPRKFKTAFSGCAKDCGLASVADLGFFAHIKDGVRGFSVYAGGGMGANSTLAVQIEEFIPADAIFAVAEAVKRVFDKYGDRTDKHKARLRYVLMRVGPDEFRRLYREELENVRISAEFGVGNAELGSSQSLLVSLPLGDIKAEALVKLADLASSVGGTLRTAQDQNLYLRGFAEADLSRIYEALKQIDERFVAQSSIKAVACAGASTCKLGLCLSRNLAQALESELQGLSFDLPIRISGCPNSCGHHPIAPIGLFGSARRINGRLVPYYTVVAGGYLSEGSSKLAQFIGRVPAKAVPAFFRGFFEAAEKNRLDGETSNQLIDRWGVSFLHELVEKYDRVPSYEENPDFYRDFGSSEDFSLAGRGPGECGAGVMDVVVVDVDAAKTAFKANSLYDAVLSASRALLVTRGLEPKKDREVFKAFSEHLITPGWVYRESQAILDAAIDFKLGDRETLDDLRCEIRALIERVEELYHSLDSNLEFRIDPVEDAPACSLKAQAESNEVDLRGVACPMNFVHAKIHLEQIETGEVLDILLDDGEPVRNVPASFADQGQEVVSVSEENGHFRVKVRRIS